MALFGYVYSANAVEQKAFEELSYADQYYLINDEYIGQPIIEPIKQEVKEVYSTAKTTVAIATLIGLYLLYKKGGK